MEINAYLRYCRPGSPYFDLPDLDGGRFDQADLPAPPGWRRRTSMEWVNLLAPRPLPDQGWKIHVSATPRNAGEVLQTCWNHCVRAEVSFKFLRSREVLALRSSKYADRAASGKFVTIYTRDDDELTALVAALETQLGGSTGPRILSDVRWRDGPLHLRYGGFALRETRTESGDRVPAIEDETGRLVPDERRPGFHPPAWVTLPPVVAEAVAARSAGRLTSFPYRPARALHFSNGGGVYVAQAADGTEVLLKEARPYAGLDGSGEDAVARLEHEAWAYRTLDGMPETPTLRELRVGHEHHFLVRELVDGQPLATVSRRDHPLMSPTATAQDRERFATWALDVIHQVEAGLHDMHARGVVFGDLQPSNVLLRPDGSVCFIDFEGARRVDDDRPLALGTPGYMAPPTFRGPAVDDYSLAMLALDLLVPLARLVAWDERKVHDLLALAHRHFPLPEAFDEWVVTRLRMELPRTPRQGNAGDPEGQPWGISPSTWPEDTGDPGHWPAVADALAAGLLGQATPERDDRLYPGDARQLVDPAGGVTFAHGAAGVLWVLARTGAQVPEPHLTWFRDRALSTTWERPGFHDGVAGVALTLATLGDHDAGRQALLQAQGLIDPWTGRDLASGLSGIGLTALALDALRPHPDLRALADDITARLVEGPAAAAPRMPGLLDGECGPALMLLRQYERTGDTGLLDLAVDRLLVDSATLEQRARSAFGEQFDGLAGLPWFEGGSGGLALVAQQVGAHREDERLRGLLDRVRAGARVTLIGDASLHRGHAGLVLLTKALAPSITTDVRSVMQAHASMIRLHSTTVRAHLSLTGRFDLRVCADLATGAAGALLALRALDDDSTRMPLL